MRRGRAGRVLQEGLSGDFLICLSHGFLYCIYEIVKKWKMYSLRLLCLNQDFFLSRKRTHVFALAIDMATFMCSVLFNAWGRQ
ncbi:hypothetical protein UZ73_08285 [Alcaligenes faecalis]|nr:hypothetical protein UZ73_08285 [Alcaligenes faecalis]